jgi:uncharacterized membrane protein YesL
MAQLGVMDRLKKRFTFNRLERLNQHFLAIKDEVKPGKIDKQEVEFFCAQFSSYYKRTNTLSNIRLFFYTLLYAAILVNLLKTIKFLAVFVTFIELGHALFGTTILVAVIFLLTARINLNLELMQDCLTHLIVVYHKNPKRNSAAALQRISKAI